MTLFPCDFYPVLDLDSFIWAHLCYEIRLATTAHQVLYMPCISRFNGTRSCYHVPHIGHSSTCHTQDTTPATVMHHMASSYVRLPRCWMTCLKTLLTGKPRSIAVLQSSNNCTEMIGLGCMHRTVTSGGSLHSYHISINQSIIFNVLGTNRGPTDNQSIQ